MKCKNYVLAIVFSAFLIISGCASTTPLINASITGDSLAVQKLIDGGANIDEPDSRGYNALFYAIENGQIEIVQLLISKGANLESKDSSGLTLLIFAIHWDFPNTARIVEILIKSGADINAKGPEGRTVLDYSLASAQGNILDILIRERSINLWTPQAGKARIFFVADNLYDYVTVTVGKQSKNINPSRKDGVVLFDVDTGKYLIDPEFPDHCNEAGGVTPSLS